MTRLKSSSAGGTFVVAWGWCGTGGENGLILVATLFPRALQLLKHDQTVDQIFLLRHFPAVILEMKDLG